MFSFTKQPSLFLFINQFKFYFGIFGPSCEERQSQGICPIRKKYFKNGFCTFAQVPFLNWPIPASCSFNIGLYDHKMVGQKYDHRVMNKKYTTPLPYSWDVGQQKDILRWLSRQKNILDFTKNIKILPQISVKNLVSGTEIQTHNLLIVCLFRKPLDHGSRPDTIFQFKVFKISKKSFTNSRREQNSVHSVIA